MEEIRTFLQNRKKMNLLMVAINVAVFVVFTLIGNTEDGNFMAAHGACYTPFVLQGEYYRLLTSMFLHFGFQHLIYNMFCLIFMGDLVETVLGSVRYLIIYLLGGLAGNLLSMWVEIKKGSGFTLSAGASGSLFALMGALAYIAYRNRSRIGREFGQRLLLMIALSVIQGFMDRGTDNWAHIGGLIAGVVLAVILYHPKRTRVQNRYFG